MSKPHWLPRAALACLVVVGLSVAALSGAAGPTGEVGAKDTTKPSPEKPKPKPTSAAYEWLEIALEATAREHERSGARPTVGSRMLGIVVSCMYDAWAAYDDKAVPSRPPAKDFRRPKAERTLKNKEAAIGYAVYRAMIYLFPEDKKWIDDEVKKKGVDPNNNTTNRATAAGVGNSAAAAVIEYRRKDGANQHGDEVGGLKDDKGKGVPYSDWTFYRHVNPPDRIIDPDCWQPIPFDHPSIKGKKVVLGFLTPHWYRLKPLTFERSDKFRPGPPPMTNDKIKANREKLKKEVDECIEVNASLTPEQKAIVEFMRDGPKSTGQSGHWLRFAQDVCRRDKHDLDKDVKIFFAIGIVAMDAFISCWETKRYYDSSRPWTLVRHYYKGKKIRGWLGPGKGVGEIPAEKWHPYSPSVFITPPFPGYTSGHATVSGACARTLEHFTGSDDFGETENRIAGDLTEKGFACRLMQAVDGKHGPAGLTCNIALKLGSFRKTAQMAAVSRMMGGYHIRTDNEVGLKTGITLADHAWPVLKTYFDGTAYEAKKK
jgi:hypothetical protein